MSKQTSLFESEDASAVRQHLNAVEDRDGGGRSLTKFIQNFRVLSEASSGIQDIKRLIFRLAVTGKLVPQSDREGTGSELLREILSKRAAFVRTPATPPGTNELPELPKSWIWASLDSLLVVLRNGVSTRPHGDSGVPVLRISAIRPYLVSLTETRFLPGTGSDYEGYFITEGDLLFTRYSGNPEFVGACGVVPPFKGSIVHPDKLIRGVVVKHLVDPRFVSLAASAGASRAFIDNCGRTTAGQVGISGKQLKAVPMPLPPLAEQKRIVAKVDQLMALCDELEVRLTKRRETGTRLTKSALEALTAAESPKEFDAAWNRVVENFGVLVDTADKVGPLRQRILALAVAGRLCGSESKERSAHAELPMILAARREQVRNEPADASFSDAPPLPSHWCWTSLDSLLILLRNGVSTRPEGEEGVPVLRISAVRPNSVSMSELRFLPGKPEDYEGAFVKPGDLLFTRYSGNAEFVGACGVVPSGAASVVHPDKLIRGEVVPELVDARFIALAMSTGASRTYIDKCGQTTAGQIGISGKQLKSAPVPLPPLQEQRRIVAKVEQLMRVCDQLEERLRRAEHHAAKLVEAAVQGLIG